MARAKGTFVPCHTMRVGPIKEAMNNITTMHLRVARPTSDLQRICAFYRDALGLKLLGQFGSPDTLQGLMLGHPQSPYHFEFTWQAGVTVARSPSPEHVNVLYFDDNDAWQQTVARMGQHGHAPVVSANPYWDQFGKTFEDFEGYRLVLCRSEGYFAGGDEPLAL